MEDLGGPFALQPTPIAPLVTRLVDTMRLELEPWATVDVRADGPCATFVAPVGVALILVLALTSALDSIRASGIDSGHIGVFVTEVEEAVVLDVRDNGRHPSRLLESHVDTRRTSGISLFRLRDRLRSCGGELLVDADETGTLVRAMLPVSPESLSNETTTLRARRKVYEQPG
jgi:signal transduction histidine kinase